MVESVPFNIEEAGEQLLRILTGMEEIHEDLLECLGNKREAVRRADPGALGEANERELRIIGQLMDLDRSRRTAVRQISRATIGEAREDVPVSDLVGHLPEEVQSDLLEARGRLRGLVARARDESRILRETCGILRNHVEGLVQRMHGEMSRSKVYGRSGRIENESSACATLDIRQ